MPESVEDIEKEVWTSDDAVPDYVRESISEAIDAGAVFDRIESAGREVGERFHDIRNQIEDLLEENLTQPQGWSLESVRDDLQESFPNMSEGQAETVARSETSSVLNTAREEGYEDRDDSHEYYYKWVGPDDSRTTDACERLKALTNPDYGGTPVGMSDLKRLERKISNEEFPALEWREHMLHINERHTFRRVLPHELNRLDDVEGNVSMSTSVSKDLPESVFEEVAESRFVPPESAADEIEQALEWIEEHGRDEAEGATEEGIARGRQILRHVRENEPLVGTNEEGTPYVVEIANFFNRHRENRDIAEEYEGEPWKDNGYLSWLLWGGDPADEWANALKDRLEEIGYLKSHEHTTLKDYLELVEKMGAVLKERTRREREVEEAIGEPLPRVLNRLLGENGGSKRPAMRALNELLEDAGMSEKVSSATFYSWVENYRLRERDYSTY
jgi:nucleotide-binding universal stress UspA family protein